MDTPIYAPAVITSFNLPARADTGFARRTTMGALRASLTTVLVITATACATIPPSNQSAPAIEVPKPNPHTAEADISAELDRLRQRLAEQVPDQAEFRAEDDHAWMEAAVAAAAGFDFKIDRPQLIVVVDRNPKVQRLRIMLATPEAAWRTAGGGKVSTGQSGRRGYFITPTGVFRHTDAIIDYRALGTPNEQGIRGLGVEGMRVWDFGWQSAVPGWGSDPEPREIRLLIHATDPQFPEPRLGRPASKGCIRIAAAMNRFLDLFGVLDADHERAAMTDKRIAHVLDPGRTPTPLAGNTLIVIDTSPH